MWRLCGQRGRGVNELKVFNHNGVEVVDSRDVAAMVERNHNELLKSVRTYIGYLREGDFAQSDFFIDSTYLNAQNHETPCYLITKKGCDMIANKMTGKKGVLFTAAYVTAFERMRERLTSAPAVPPAVSPGGLARLISVTRRVMLDMGSTPQEVGQMTRAVFNTWNIPMPECFNKQLPGQLSIWEQGRLTVGAEVQ